MLHGKYGLVSKSLDHAKEYPAAAEVMNKSFDVNNGLTGSRTVASLRKNCRISSHVVVLTCTS